MKLAILSDDLTGASGVASMLHLPNTITVDFRNLSKIGLEHFAFVSINLDIREKEPTSVIRTLEKAMGVIGAFKFALRIDSTLRGNVGLQIQSILNFRDVLITDTIPEYGRYTEDGFTIYHSKKKKISQILPEEIQKSERNLHEFTIADSKTYEDLDRLAFYCIDHDLVPIDPGPMIARYAANMEKIDENFRS